MVGKQYDATGRSTGTPTGRLKKLLAVPANEPWVWLTRELLASPAWRAQSINCRRLIDFLLVDHANHAGTENGNLMAPYDQLVESGASRSEICNAVDEAKFLGLLWVNRGGRWAGTNQPSTYQLTFLPTVSNMQPATNDWKGKTPEAIKAWKADRTARKKARREYRKKQIPGSASRTTVVRLPELPNRKRGSGI